MNPHASALTNQIHTFRPDMVEHVKLIIWALEHFEGKIVFTQKGKER